jgi:G6PDH family F420-dependent oxidoreductase
VRVSGSGLFMTSFGYSLMSEEHDPRTLVRNAVAAEEAGFDFVTLSDHFHPWLFSQGQSPFAWSVLGAIAERTERVDIVTAVTCPTIRYHPAIIAQAAATVALMSEGRFGLGVGAGELLNEHVVGDAWPGPDIRHDMLSEAIEVMRLLWRGGRQRHHGDYYDVQDAQLFTLPDTPPEVYVAGGGPRALRVAAEQGDGMFATEPERSLVDTYRSHGGEGKRFGQLAVCFDADEEKATRTAHERWRFAMGWPVQAELPNPSNFEVASRTVRPEDVTEQVAVGPDPERHATSFRKWIDAGFDHICVVQIGPEQDPFFRFWRNELHPRLSSR